MSDPKQQAGRRPAGQTDSAKTDRRIASAGVLLLLAAVAMVGGCRFDLTTVLDGTSGLPLAISPSSTTVESSATVSFEAEGGIPPYTYAVVQGTGTITAVGLYTAPATVGSETVRVTDATGKSAEAEVVVASFSTGLAISPSALSLNVNGSVTFTVIGGTTPYTFAIISAGSGSPDINANTGYYVAGGIAGTDIIEVTDSDSNTAAATVTVTPVSTSVDYRIPSTTFAASGTAGTAMLAGEEFTVENIGSNAGSATMSWKVYLSSNTVLDGGDILVASGTTPALGAGASTPVSVSGTYPSTTGSYYLIAEVSAGDDMDPANNASAASALTLSPKDVDYNLLSVVHTGGSAAGGAMNGDFDYQNLGSYGGFYTVYYEVYASTDTTLDAGDPLVVTGSTGPLAAGGSDTESFSGVWPTTPGDYYLVVTLSAMDDIASGNNQLASASAVTVAGTAPADVDYVIDSVTNTGQTYKGGAISGEFVYSNQGTEAGTAAVYYNVYVSTDVTLNVGTDPMIDSGTASALAGSTAAPAPVGFNGTWPSTAGTYYLIVRVSSSDDVISSNNTSASGSVSVNAPDIDYAVTSVSNLGGAVTEGDIDGEFFVQNVGTVIGGQTAYWTAYLSTDSTLQIGTDPVLDSGILGILGAGASAGPIPISGSWPSAAGTCYLIVRVTADDDVDTANNTTTSAAINVTVPQVDYYPAGIGNTGGTTVADGLNGEFTIQRDSGDPGSDRVYWRVYVSTDTNLDIGVDQIADSGDIGALSSGGSFGPIAFSGTWPVAPGSYYFIVSLSAGDDVNPVNDVQVGGAVSVTAPDVDYSVETVSNTGGTTTSGALDGSFTVSNVGLDDGIFTVYWTAYLSSDANYDPGVDTVVDTGSFSPLGAGGQTVPAVNFSGTWPSTAGTYYLIVRVSASDDVSSGNDTKASSSLSVTAPDVNYSVETVSNTGGTTTGGALDGSFTAKNVGGDEGGSTVYWTAYLSSDTNYDPGLDTVIDTGSFGPLSAGAQTLPAVSFSGTWPGSAGTWYLIVKVEASDDVDNVNNLKVSSGVPVTSPTVYPNYAVTSVTAASQGSPGSLFSAAGAHSFTIEETAGNAGSQPIDWWVYVSENAILDAGDAPAAASGNRGALGSLGTATIPFDGTWPGASGFYYLIVRIAAADDSEPADDTGMSGEVAIPILFIESEPNDDNQKPFAAANIDDLGTMGPYELVAVSATMDAAAGYDTFKFIPDTGVSRVEIRAVWNTGVDDIDIYFWNDSTLELITQNSWPDSEPQNPPWTIINLTPLSNYYVGAWFFLDGGGSGNTGKPYTLYINTKP